MRAKACTRCRQWKVRCDIEDNNHSRCTRCHNLNIPCVFDGKFKRVSKHNALAALQAEVQRLTRMSKGGEHGQCASGQPTSKGTIKRASTLSTASHDLCRSDSARDQVGMQNRNRDYDSSLANTQPQLQFIDSLFTPCVAAKSIGDLVLTAAQVNELFRVFFTRCHAHLPFAITKAVEEVHSRSPLLFWAICAISSDAENSMQMMPYIHGLIPSVLSPPHNVEVVQGLLLVSIWPFPFSTQSSDPSSLYTALAVQIGYNIGLHRPTLATEFEYTFSTEQVEIETRRSTWMACYTVSQIQSSRRGIAMSIKIDSTLLHLVDDSTVDSILATLCQISMLSDQAATSIGADADNISGLLEPKARVRMVKLFSAQFETLQRSRHPEKNEITEMAFLTARLHLWTFILLEDVIITPDILGLLLQAENDATQLIRISCEKNLSLVPFHVCRAVFCSAVILIKILKSPFMIQHELLRDQIDRARLALRSASRAEGDMIMNVCNMLQEASRMEPKKSTNPIRSRMSFSLVCDFIRSFTEHINAVRLQHYHNETTDLVQCANGDGGRSAQSLDMGTFDGIDLDGLDWDEFML
jgi:Fungal specific transcription factor domain/Fungal Zn(2)-Cys(6) binuclear cluster domain